MHTHLGVTYLKRSGTRFNVKKITNEKLIMNVLLYYAILDVAQGMEMTSIKRHEEGVHTEAQHPP